MCVYQPVTHGNMCPLNCQPGGLIITFGVQARYYGEREKKYKKKKEEKRERQQNFGFAFVRRWRLFFFYGRPKGYFYGRRGYFLM